MKKSRSCALLGAGAMLASCSHAAADRPPPSQFAPARLIYGTQVSTGKCVGGVEAAGLLATLAGAFIAQGVNRIGKGIEEAAKADTQTALARRNLELSGEGFGPCIVVARGWFYRDSPLVRGDPRPLQERFSFNSRSAFPIKTIEGVGELWRMGLFLASSPDFYFQGRLVPNSAKTAYVVLPIHSSLDRPILSNRVRSDRRSVTISFALAKGGASSLQNGSTIVLGRLTPGVLSEFPDGTCVIVPEGGQPSLGPCPQAKQEKVVRIVRTAFESEWFSPEIGAELKPMTLLAQVTETRDESRFLSFVSALFNDVKTPLTTGLQQALVPELGAAAAEAETTAQESADNALDSALAEAAGALKACEAAPAELAKRTAARVALRKLIAAARKADKPTPVTETQVNAIDPAGSDPNPCSAALALLKS